VPQSVWIPNGIDIRRFAPDPAARQRMRDQWNIREGVPMVGVVGRFDPMKDHETFFRATAIAVRILPELRVAIVGGGSAEAGQRLKKLAEELGISSNVVWQSPTADMPGVYNALDVFCLSSLYGEGFPNVVGEAMACGRPCVVTDVGDAAFIVGDLGTVVAPRDPEALARAWMQTLTAPRHTPVQIRRRIEDHFTIGTLADRTEDYRALEEQVSGEYDVIVHLAAKAGVRPSIQAPLLYQEVNVAGTQNMLELARRLGVRQFVFTSSSSVYGINPRVPWKEADAVLMPISPYASTKVSGELLGHVYSHLYGIRFVALRLFTVFGPRQRPDLAIRKFADLMLNGRPVELFGDGTTRRDYTFVGDIVEGFRAAIDYDGSSYEIFNLSNERTVSLVDLVQCLENVLSTRADIRWLPEQPGDVPQTWGDTSKARNLLGYQPKTSLDQGISEFYSWYRHTQASAAVL
jgi:UDP-glucuronate 4-epimerase